jgi:nitrite reductase/ring-hydroxylating ferredoxin subunit
MIVTVPAGEVPASKPLAVRVSEQLTLAVCAVEGTYYAFDARCPHRGAMLSDGEFSGDLLVCPLHHFKFSLKTGRCMMPKHLKLLSFRVSEEGGELRIELEMEEDAPRPV